MPLALLHVLSHTAPSGSCAVSRSAWRLHLSLIRATKHKSLVDESRGWGLIQQNIRRALQVTILIEVRNVSGPLLRCEMALDTTPIAQQGKHKTNQIFQGFCDGQQLLRTPQPGGDAGPALLPRKNFIISIRPGKKKKDAETRD